MWNSEAAGQLYRRLRKCCPHERPKTGRRYETKEGLAWDAKRALDSVVGNFFPGRRGTPALTLEDQRRFLRGISWLPQHLEGLRALRQRQGRASDYDARRFREDHQAWKEERSRLFAVAARACAKALPKDRRGAVVLLDDVDGRRGVKRLRSTEALRRETRDLGRRAPMVFMPNPRADLCALARASGSTSFQGTLYEALREGRVPRDVVAAYLDYCTGTPAIALRDLKLLLPLLRKTCALSVTLTTRDPRGGGSLVKRLHKICDELSRNGFVSPAKLRDGMDVDGKAGTICLLRGSPRARL
jgi:hypothetical protein